MNNRFKIAICISIILNIVFGCVSMFIVYKKGVIFHVIKTISMNNQNTLEDFYIDRYSLFSIMPNKSDAIIFLGDSLTNQCDWSEILSNSQVINRGISGDTTQGMLRRLDVSKQNPSKVFMMIGINDIATKVSKDKIIENYAHIIDKIQRESPNTVIYVQSLLPVNEDIYVYHNKISNIDIITVNNEIHRISREHNIKFIDLYPLFLQGNQMNAKYTTDGIHLNGNGYKVWTDAIKELVDH